MKTHIPGFVAGLALGTSLATAAFVSGGVSASTGAAFISGGASTSTAAIDQGAASSASSVKIVLENERVRVRDVTFGPGVTPMHKHELPHVGVVIQGGTLVFRSPDGKSETMKLEPGGAGFREANVSHEPTNPGTSPVRVIEVELK
jgi:mannose-6-phosphate isomerase-like protein (cupin superfamily)